MAEHPRAQAEKCESAIIPLENLHSPHTISLSICPQRSSASPPAPPVTDAQDPLRAVLPLPLHTTSLHPSSLKAIFSALSTLQYADLPPVIEPLAPSVEQLRRLAFKNSNQTSEGSTVDQQPSEAGEVEVEVKANAEAENVSMDIDKDMIYMAIVTADSTVVYYRLSKGIKKPADIPDE